MTKKMNAVFICRDKLDDKDNYYGFVVYEGDDPIIKEMYDKISEKLGFTKNNENEVTLCQISKMKKEFEATRKIVSNLYKFEVSDIKSQSYDEWAFDGFGGNYKNRIEFDNEQKKILALDKKDNL
jgi:hypothetical protein